MKTCASKGLNNPTCVTHGGAIGEDRVCATYRVLDEVARERGRQFARYGTNAALADGTGPETQWAYPVANDSAEDLELRLREEYELHEHRWGKPTWMHLLREEFAEAMQEDDPDRLEEELIQVAAVAVSWVEKIRARRA